MSEGFYYDYCDCKEGESQYKGIDLSEGQIVQAKYIPSRMEYDRGNPYIEALPLPFRGDAAKHTYRNRVPGYKKDKVKNMSRFDRILQVALLDKVRFPLIYQDELETDFYNTLLSSYRDRRPVWACAAPIQCTVRDQEFDSSCKLNGSAADATNAGFSLIGYSGSGKSSSVSSLVSHYPQVIIHENKYGKFPQIVYLVVNAVPSKNIKAVYQGIGDAVDKALGNTEPFYAKIMDKATTVGQMQARTREIIEKFAVGVLIVDEIQFMDFRNDDSFESLVTLSNYTKVGLVIVGTEDAKEKMAPQLRMARRIGHMIDASKYCKNKAIFKNMVKNLLYFQWFDEVVPMTDDLVDALYDVTKGIVEDLISVYSSMTYEYLSYGEDDTNKPIINGDYVRKIAKSYYPGLQRILRDLDNGVDEEAHANALRDGMRMSQDLIDEAAQKKKERELLDAPLGMAEEEILENVREMIQPLHPEYTDALLVPAFDKVIKRNGEMDKDMAGVARDVLDVLQKQPKKRVKKSNTAKVSVEQMKKTIVGDSSIDKEGDKTSC